MLKKIILIFSFIFLISTVYSASAPVLPASYYGTVNVEGGGVLNNVKLVAKINGEVRGSIIVKDNKFGGPSYSEEKLKIDGTQEDNGKTVEFYIGNYKSKETVIWKSGDVKELSLTFPRNVLYCKNSSYNNTSTNNSSNENNNNEKTASVQTTTIITYPDVAKDIKSEKIKEIVHNAKLIIGSEIDNNLSAKCLKNTTELINQPLEITEDCILVGGPVANPLAKKYLYDFKIKVTNDYPGANKGVIEKQIINGHTVILLAGSDRYGTKAAVEYFKTLDDIPSEPIFVEWKDGKAVKIEKP
ncbi:S-layer protein [Methanothermococcus sp.]|uniref:S-layer protein n=1 Tax=Methanothermococcus sp. TaxID=2614238 RepID=UPI0025CE6847|nr:S-layer protein [Methanothermococcus sp.]